MKNYVQPGNVITIPAPIAVLSGEFVRIGNLTGVAANTAAAGEPLDLATVGVFSFPKTAAAFALGDSAYWDATSKLATDDDEKPIVGIVAEAAATDDATVKVLIRSWL